MENKSKWQLMFEALLGDGERQGDAREIARHLARVALYEWKDENALHPQLRPLAAELIRRSLAAGYKIQITETYRSGSTQQKYYKQGRTGPGGIITNAQALESYHQYGLAFDFCFTGELTSYPRENKPWEIVGKIGQDLGLVWGGTFGDKPHFEYSKNISWETLKKYFNV